MVPGNRYDGFLGALKRLCHNDKICSKACSKFIHRNDLYDSDVENLLPVLASLLLSQQQTLVVAHHLSDALPNILSVAMGFSHKTSFDSGGSPKLLHEKRCVALGKLITIRPDVVILALKYFNDNPSPFHEWKLLDIESEPKAKKRKMAMSPFLEPVSDEEIVLCCFSFVKLKTDYFRDLWDWSKFMTKFMNHEEPYVRWLACQSSSLILKMGNLEKDTLLESRLNASEIIDFSVKYSTEGNMIMEKYAKISLGDSCSDIDCSLPYKGCGTVTSVAGITLPCISKVPFNFESNLVLAHSTETNLQAIALGIATGKTLCLQGPVGCGKTALVEHLAKLTGRSSPPLFLSVQLGDQTDSKMLLGTYQCTDIPGEFVWKPGVLTQAVVGGYWLLLEDIDSCTTDVAAVLASLLETGNLSVPGYKDCVHAAPGFQLFLTQRLITGATGLHKLHSGSTNMLQRHCLTVQMEPLSSAELVEIVKMLYPSLKTVASRMVDVFLLFSAGSHHTSLIANDETYSQQSSTVRIQTTGARLPSTRDLIKWCTRSSEAFDVSSPESGLKLFQDAVDTFCCNVSNSATRLELAQSIAAKLGIVHTKAEYFCNVYKPVISSTPSHILTGRITLPRRQADTAALRSTQRSTFSFTRPAAALLERIASCISHSEPVLLVGETGVGKTSSIQYLAQQMGQSLSVINMNQQSDSADLLGGFKPVELRFIMSPIRDEFETLFRKFFSVNENAKFLNHIAHCFSLKKWTTLMSLMKHSTTAALKRFDKKQANVKLSRQDSNSDSLFTPAHKNDWLKLSMKLHKVEEQLKKSQNALAFAFVEGSLVRALKKGHWVLLDEINLASAQTLECLSSLLEGSTGSLYLLERGDNQLISRNADFRIFAAMNPATDVGKRELPPGIRNRFTEFYVDELVDRQDLLLLCGSYLAPLALPASKLEALVRFYLTVCQEAIASLSDGTGQKPHYSLRTLCRALSVAAANPCGSIPRSLYEGILLSFLTQLDRSSHPVVENMVAKAVIGKGTPESLIKQPIPAPIVAGNSFVQIEGYWITQGPIEPITPDKYILTKTVRQNLHDLVRVVSLARLPVLLQGETSVGKTSLITYLAQASGNRCLRINNHEHTDLQEYIGSYAADEQGNLVFKEGVLVEAMRCGHWVILDELNLAPSDVLEALNRVLDDNRELFIPETQKVVKAHPNFMLFATQNPPGLYGGRKVLSRAFRNRFIELHFDEIPAKELETIMHLRCDLPPTYCKKMVAVMADLQIKRKGSAAFAGKQGFITLRDLFRWGERYRLAQNQTRDGKFYDWDQHIADEGYLILAGRVRKEEERVIIQDSLKKHIKRSVDPVRLFTLNNDTSTVTRGILESFIQQTPPGFSHIVWTYSIRRLAVLLGKACEFKEPILLVGETGCGKTTLCQLLAASRNQDLATVNCHMHSESADFLGGLRPVREHSEEKKGKLFEWVDGPLIEAMLRGSVFLADEISLADDSVLERLNSLLEPERKLLLAEKGSDVGGEPYEITAKDGFIFVGTMNPGGDYGKKELSPALRNRFTEIWCDGCSHRSDLIAVIEHNLRPELTFRNAQNSSSSVGSALVDFLEWFSATELGNRLVSSIRDVMTWVNFINICTGSSACIDLGNAYIHGACLTFLDSLGTGITSFTSREDVQTLRATAVEYLRKQVKEASDMEPASLLSFLTSDPDDCEVLSTVDKFGIKPFFVPRGCSDTVKETEFLLSAPTTCVNAMRVLRGLQLGKALLLEGSPGVGKTSLVAALARAAGHQLIRINLSDQTDIADLFGADLPVEGGRGGEFAWRDGPFLQALRSGHWILLDELNLASQSVLEGLNAVLDHRGDLFIPELGRTFRIQSERTRLFACQNPLNQGGARKGLPQSFLNRFTQVYMESLTKEDLEYICKTLYPTLPIELIQSMVKFNQLASSATAPGSNWGQRGAPWEMNLRDLCRWCELTVWGSSNGALNPGRFVQLIYVDRMRTVRDKEEMMTLYSQTVGEEHPLCSDIPQAHITPGTLYLGDVTLSRGNCGNMQMHKLLLRHQLPMLQSLARCVSLGWLSIVVGPSGCGKTSLVHLLAQLAGRELRTLSVNSAMDTTEILGGFEQTDYKRHLDEISVKVQKIMTQGVQNLILSGQYGEANKLLCFWEAYLHLNNQDANERIGTTDSDVNFFCHKIDALVKVLCALPEDAISSQRQQELDLMLQKMNSLRQFAKEDNSLNAGGKFEWVDSILVKSLVEGCWLLVDNVNLCSAAVLDRLNGLLEPNGVLTISERGVNSNGELVTIRPHPDFRLFLAMDPKYGEISRAMRNRGVEVYVATFEGDITASLSPLDQAALLYDIGVCSHSDQQLLLQIHHTMSNAIPGPDPPGLSELLHAAFLFVQQVQRGMPPIPSLVSSFTKVYIQSRLCDSIDIKRRNLAVLEAIVQREVQAKTSDVLDKLIADSTLKTGDLHLNSCFASVKQRCAILSAVAFAQENELDTISEFLGLQEMKVDFQMVITHLVTLFYQTCSIADVSLGYKWLLRKIVGSDHGSVVTQLSEALHSTLVEVDDLAESHLIWDRRWLPDVSAAIAVQSGDDDQGVENRVALLLHFTAQILRSEHSLKLKIEKKHKKISVLEYSHAVSEGSLADNLSLAPFFIELGPCLNMTLSIMNDTLRSVGVHLSDDLWWSIRKALKWTLRFQRQAGTLFVSSDKNSAAETLNFLAVHYRWFMKHAVPMVTHLAKEAFMNVIPFSESIEKMNASVFSNNSVLWHVAKRLRNEMGQPLPMASERQALLSFKASSLSGVINIWSGVSTKEDLIPLAHFLLKPEGLQAKAVLMLAMKDLLTISDIDKVEERLLQVEELCSKAGLTTDSSKRGGFGQSSQLKTLEMMFWPFQEAMCLHGTNTLLAFLLEGKVPSSMLKNSGLLEAMRRIPSVPSALVAFFQAFHVEKCAQELSRGIYWLLQFSTQSLAVTNLKNWVPRDIDCVNEDMDIQEDLPQHCPALSRLSANLLFSHQPSNKVLLSMSSLDQHTGHSRLLQSLQALFWRNADSLCNPHYSYRENEKNNVISALQHFITGLEKSCHLTTEQNLSLQERVTSVVEHLEFKLGSRSSSLIEFYAMLLEVVSITHTVEKSNSKENETLMMVGLVWALLGCLESQLFSASPQIDPMSKHAIKLQYTKEEILSTKSELLAAQMLSSVRGSCTLSHPHLNILQNHVNELERQLSTLSRQVAVRPDPPLFSALTKEMHHFASSLSSAAVVSNLTKRLVSIGSTSSLMEAKRILKEAKTWLHSQWSFRTMFEKRFGTWYPDMVYPLLASNAKLCRGVELLFGIGKKICYSGLKEALCITLGKLICSFGNFPTMSFEQPSLMDLVSNLTDRGIALTMEQALFTVRETETVDLKQHTEMEAYWLLKSALMELKNYICVSASCRTEEWYALVETLRRFMNMWQRQETERRERELDTESLYKSRGALRCQTVSENDQDDQEIAEMFPSMRDNDFGDLEPCNTLDDAPQCLVDGSNPNTLNVLLNDEDIAFVSTVHMSLVLAYTEATWIDGCARGSISISTDFLTPWIQRCAVAARLVSTCGQVLDDYVDRSLLPSWILASYLAIALPEDSKRGVNINPEDPAFNFYRTSCLDEVKQCKPVLDGLLKRVKDLLSEWPEHPTLNQIAVVISRINSFPISSPVSRFLTGLEILLNKTREWEENAHSGVSLATQTTAVTNLIIQWRRLELNSWKGCLNSAALHVQSKASRWWFYVFSLVDSHIRCDPSSEGALNAKDLVSTLERFMEEAPLGEFEKRLDLLLAFHCHLINLSSSDQQKELLSILWNLHGFYSQFKDIVSSRISELKAPIEKKLKDYVKIARWNDINYWAVKEAVFKTQRTLHKHVKEFENVLKQPARSVMLSSRLEGKGPSKRALVHINPQLHIVKADYQHCIIDASGLDFSVDSLSVVYRAGPLFNRSKKLAKEIILSSSCPGLVAALDEFASDIVAQVQQLATLEVDRSIPKSKQVSQAKNQLQMKRKALADLFRILQQVGLSHYTGLTYEETHLKYEFTQLPPLDLCAHLKSLSKATGSPLSLADKEILNVWDGCSSYLMRSWARYVQLCLALRNPHKDHGPPNIERLRGFPAHLLVLTHDQHKEVNKNANLLAQMKMHLFHLESCQEYLSEPMPSQPILNEWNQRLQSLLASSSITMQQFRLLLDTCPENEGTAQENIPVLDQGGKQASSILGPVKGDIYWEKAVNIVDQVVSSISECIHKVNGESCNLSSRTELIFTVKNFKTMCQCYNNILCITENLAKLQKIIVVDSSSHPCTRSLRWLTEHMVKECQMFSEMCNTGSKTFATSTEDAHSFNDISSKVNDLMQTVLLAIQKMYKSYTSFDEPPSNELNKETQVEGGDQLVNDDDADFDLQEKHLSDGILKSLQNDFKNLCVLDISRCLQSLVDSLLTIVYTRGHQSSNAEKCVRLAMRSVPLLHQWLLLFQFVVQQQVAAYRTSGKLLSILLAVFGDVTVKGFCTPEDLMSGEEAGDGDGQADGKQDGSMGLGDGEGEKDVSDRIESEDQLDDARPAGEEKKDEDKDCKEEEQGIEMSENFDGKLQDVDPKGDEDDEDEDEDKDKDDAEKEMGDTEKDAEQLDQQIWGSDSEEDNSDEEGHGGEEDGNSGERTGEKEVGARENDAKKDDKNEENSNENKDGGNKEENKPEVNEMKEPEVDDDQVDPYHGNMQPEAEPDPLELPDDLQLDDGETKENEEGNDENPFDIDEMKDQMPPETQPDDTNKESQNEKEQEHSESEASDDDDLAEASNEDKEAFDEPGNDEEQDDNMDKSDERKDGIKQEDIEKENNTDSKEEKGDLDERNPSKDDPTAEPTEASDDNHQGSKDQVASTPDESQQMSGEQPPEDADGDPGGEERDAVGQAPTNQELKGHHSDRSGKRPQRDQQKQPFEEEEKRQRPGHSDNQRSLGDIDEPLKKRLKTVDIKQKENEEDDAKPEDDKDMDDPADLYQHIKDVKEKSKMQTLDAATEEQAEQQSVPRNNDDDEEAPQPDDETIGTDSDEIITEDNDSEKKQKDETTQGSKKNKHKKEQEKVPSQEEFNDSEKGIEVDGERVDTLGVSRGPDTTFHTRYEDLVLPNIVSVGEVQEQYDALRKDLQDQLASWNQEYAGEEASKAWLSLSSLTNSLARDLSEQLRLVLEPTQATRMKGDFRTGRRINMRKVIPYIASQFRKDKIWMRRTKPSKREYQIILAIDDSSSMADNRSKELAFESLALVSQALTLLEVGDLGVLSYGETVKVLHKLGEPFTQHSGARLLQQFLFEQRKTQIGKLVDFVSALFATSKVQTSAEHAQLLVVVSDGQGIFSEGQDKVCSCVRKARLAGIFMVFVIIDNPENKRSVLDIGLTKFKDGKVEISPYMDSFPFPFYLILRDISNLPSVLSDALRQWFELVSNAE